jgi:hypothetical protein
MNRVFLGLMGIRCFAYLDEVILFGESLQEDNERLIEVLERIRQFNLKVEPDKCEFLKTELSYLGHIVTSDGVRPYPGKVKAINEFPTPKNRTDVKSFFRVGRLLPKIYSPI